LYELSRQKILKGSPRNLEKVLFVAGFTTKACRFPKIDPADHVPPARSEIFYGQKFLVRKFLGRIFFGSKFENPKKFPVEI